jgi:DNA-binding NtrC family response regulator
MSERYCILCVDDDVICLEARAALLEEEGYSVTVVSCPLRALEHDVSKFHMAILDFDTCLFSTDSSSCDVYALHAHLFRSCCSAV